jgi:hypothetical protein
MAERLKDYDYHALCYRVLRRDGWKCRNCGFRANLHVHHIWFRSQGGPDDIWNLVTLCNACHDGVHTAIKDGEHGLTVRVYAVTGDVEFIAASWWRPTMNERRHGAY